MEPGAPTAPYTRLYRATLLFDCQESVTAVEVMLVTLWDDTVAHPVVNVMELVKADTTVSEHRLLTFTS